MAKFLEQDIEGSEVLLKLLLLSAGLVLRRSRAEIAGLYPAIAQYLSDHRNLDRQLRHSIGVSEISGLDRLIYLVSQYRPADLILATAHHGHFVAFFGACAQAGIPLAACYRSASQPYLRFLQESGVAMVNLERLRSTSELFDNFDRLRREGRYIALMIDAPFASRRRYQLLGYSVQASSVPSLYARRSGASLLPIVGTLISARQLGYVVSPIVTDTSKDCTPALLGFLEKIILEQAEQYAWSTNSIILSDEKARENALSFTADALNWRNASYHRT